MFRRVSLAEVALHALMLGTLGTVIVCGGLLMHHGINPLRAYFTGTSGYVTVADCHWVEEPRGDDGFQCHGVFNGSGLRVDDVMLRFRPNEEPVNPVPVLVIGADATDAWQPGWGLLVPFPGGVFMAGLGLVYLLRWWFTD